MYMYLLNELVQYLILETYSSGGTTQCGPRFETEAVLTCDLVV